MIAATPGEFHHGEAGEATVIQYSAPPPIGGYQWRKAHQPAGHPDHPPVSRSAPYVARTVPLPVTLINFADVGKNGRTRP